MLRPSQTHSLSTGSHAHPMGLGKTPLPPPSCMHVHLCARMLGAVAYDTPLASPVRPTSATVSYRVPGEGSVPQPREREGAVT